MDVITEPRAGPRLLLSPRWRSGSDDLGSELGTRNPEHSLCYYDSMRQVTRNLGIASRLFIKRGLPVNLIFFVTSKCNLLCRL